MASSRGSSPARDELASQVGSFPQSRQGGPSRGRPQRRAPRRAHLHARLGQLGPLRQLLSGVDVWVVGPLEGLLQLLQLLGRERGPTAALLTLQREVGF